MENQAENTENPLENDNRAKLDEAELLKMKAYIDTLKDKIEEHPQIIKQIEKLESEKEEQLFNDTLKLIPRYELLELRFKVKDTNIDTKLYYFYKNNKNHVFIPKLSSRKWKNINFVDFIWLDILESLRKFSCPHETIEKLFDNLYSNELADIYLNSIKDELVEQLQTNNNENEENKKKLDTIQKTLENKKLMRTFDEFINSFYFVVTECLEGKVKNIVINEKQEISYDHRGEPKDALLILPISKYIVSFVKDETKEWFWKSLGLFTDKELDLLDLFKEHEYAYITLNQSEQQIKTLNELKEILVLKKYESMKVTFKNNDQVYHFYK